MAEWDDSIWQSPNSNLTMKYLWKRLMAFASHSDFGSVLGSQTVHSEGMSSGCPCLISWTFTQPHLLPDLVLFSWPPSHLTEMTLSTLSLFMISALSHWFWSKHVPRVPPLTTWGSLLPWHRPSWKALCSFLPQGPRTWCSLCLTRLTTLCGICLW